MSTAAGSAPAPPVLPPQRLGRQWTGVTACPTMPCAGRLLAPWPPLLGWSPVPVSPVFTGPLDAKMEAGGAGGGEGGGAGWGLKHFEGVLGPGPQWSAVLCVASDDPTLCPELSLWVGPDLSLSLGHQPPDQCSCPRSRSQPLPRGAIWIFPPGGRVWGEGLCSVTCQAVPPSPVCLCNYFCKNCLICGCHSLAPGLRPHLSSRPACTSLGCSGVPSLIAAWLPGLVRRGP